ncbi:MAG: ATP-binding cassette domain-containing protein, partial [Chloroflexi bacterium]|nr:ATP-binding cassette domain-containing protein [Chloroflexota bacterium]
MALAFVASTGSSLLYLVLPKILGNAVDKVVRQGHLSYLIYAGLAIISIALVRAVFAFFENYLREALAQYVAYRIRNALYDHLQRMSFAYHDKQQTGHLMSRATADVENVRWFISLGIFRLYYMFLLIIGVTAAMAMTNWWLALVSMGFIPIVVARAKSISAQLRLVWNRAQDHTAELSTILQESLTGIKVVKVFNRIDYEQSKFAAKSKDLNIDQLEAAYLQARNTPFITFAFTAMTAVILWLGGRQVLNGNMTTGELTQFIVYLALINMPVRMMGWMINLSARAVSSSQRIFEILDAESPVHDKPEAIELKGVRGRVTMENVSFSYNAASPVLRNITFEAEPGKVIALLGATGSGKSTVVHLLPRFYDATAGRVLIDGIDVRDVT